MGVDPVGVEIKVEELFKELLRSGAWVFWFLNLVCIDEFVKVLIDSIFKLF